MHRLYVYRHVVGIYTHVVVRYLATMTSRMFSRQSPVLMMLTAELERTVDLLSTELVSDLLARTIIKNSCSDGQQMAGSPVANPGFLGQC